MLPRVEQSGVRSLLPLEQINVLMISICSKLLNKAKMNQNFNKPSYSERVHSTCEIYSYFMMFLVYIYLNNLIK